MCALNICAVTKLVHFLTTSSAILVFCHLLYERAWWRFDIGTLIPLPVPCEGNLSITGGFPKKGTKCGDFFSWLVACTNVWKHANMPEVWYIIYYVADLYTWVFCNHISCGIHASYHTYIIIHNICQADLINLVSSSHRRGCSFY